MCREIAGCSSVVLVASIWKLCFVYNRKSFYFRKLLGDDLNLGPRLNRAGHSLCLDWRQPVLQSCMTQELTHFLRGMNATACW